MIQSICIIPNVDKIQNRKHEARKMLHFGKIYTIIRLTLNTKQANSNIAELVICKYTGEKAKIEVNRLQFSAGFRGVARIFQRGGGGHTVSNIIVMAFSPRNIVGCLLEKGLTKGGSRAPQDPPRYTLGLSIHCSMVMIYIGAWCDKLLRYNNKFRLSSLSKMVVLARTACRKILWLV